MHERTKLACEIEECKKTSLSWIDTNYYDQWIQVFKSYHCEADPHIDEETKEIDQSRSAIGSPLTFSHIQRAVARGTAQIPNIRHHAKDPDIAELISRTLMYQWDKGVQRTQKKHFRQTALFGWSVRAWYWALEDYTRRKRVNAMAKDLDPETLKQIIATYGPKYKWLDKGLTIPLLREVLLAKLTAKHGRGGLLPIEYEYTAYQGPRCDFLFIGDCFPERDFQSLQTAGYFIVERRRDLAWLKRIARDIPEFKEGIAELITAAPNGDERRHHGTDSDARRLRERMEAVVSRSDGDNAGADSQFERLWTISEMWIPGRTPRVRMSAASKQIGFGEISSPFDLEGKIPFTEALLIDDLLSGVGDSVARIMRGIQFLHERQMNQRSDLVYNILQPLVGTTNNELYDNPHLLKRKGGLRLVRLRNQGELWVQGEQAAMSAVAVGLQDESGIMRVWQMGAGETNLSMGSNVDPQQGRTATGSKIGAYNQDVLTKDMTDMFTVTSIIPDAEMMYLLNRSEMSEAVEFDYERYNRLYSSAVQEERQRWRTVEPAMFQVDGEITVEAGSTLADDDESNVTNAQNIFGMFAGNPTVDQNKLRDTVLTAFGKGKELQAWAAKPAPPPPPEFRSSLSISAKWEMLSLEEKQAIAPKIGMPVPEGPQIQPPPPGAVPPPPGDDPMLGASALDAAHGHSPFPQEIQ